MDPSVAGDSEELVAKLEAEARERGISVEAYVREIIENRHRADELEHELKELRDQIAERDDRIAELQSRVDDLKRAKQAAEDRISALQTDTSKSSSRATEASAELRSKIRSLEAEREELQTKIESVRAERDRLQSEIDSLATERNKLQTQTDQLNEDIERLQNRLELREERIDQLEAQLARRSQIEEKVEELSMVVREEQNQSKAPFFVRWWRWLRD